MKSTNTSLVSSRYSYTTLNGPTTSRRFPSNGPSRAVPRRGNFCKCRVELASRFRFFALSSRALRLHLTSGKQTPLRLLATYEFKEPLLALLLKFAQSFARLWVSEQLNRCDQTLIVLGRDDHRRGYAVLCDGHRLSLSCFQDLGQSRSGLANWNAPSFHASILYGFVKECSSPPRIDGRVA